MGSALQSVQGASTLGDCQRRPQALRFGAAVLGRGGRNTYIKVSVRKACIALTGVPADADWLPALFSDVFGPARLHSALTEKSLHLPLRKNFLLHPRIRQIHKILSIFQKPPRPPPLPQPISPQNRMCNKICYPI